MAFFAKIGLILYEQTEKYEEVSTARYFYENTFLNVPLNGFWLKINYMEHAEHFTLFSFVITTSRC